MNALTSKLSIKLQQQSNQDCVKRAEIFALH